MDIGDTRGLEFSKLQGWLDEAYSRKSGVSIIGVSGYGGIGKSFLLDEVLRQYQPSRFGYAEIRVDGKDRASLGDFVRMLNSAFAPVRLNGGKVGKDYFTQVRKLERIHAKVMGGAQSEIEKMEVPDQLKKAVSVVLRAGGILNRTIPVSKDFVDLDGVDSNEVLECIDEAIELIPDLSAMDASTWLPNPVADLVGKTYERRVKEDLFGLAADAYTGDLAAAFHKARKKDTFKPTQTKIKGVGGLLLVVDDFEILGKAIGEFLVEHLINHLDSAEFPTTLVIVGRDDMKDAHLDFQQYHANKVIGSLRLEKLPLDTAESMLSEAGYTDTEAKELAENSEGYPFLVSILCETKDRTVQFYKRFYDRTTRWMKEREKGWVIPLSYLGCINEETIPRVLPEENAHAVMQWFQEEASLRDPNASHFAISPFISKMIQEYNKRVVGDKRHEEMLAQASDSAT